MKHKHPSRFRAIVARAKELGLTLPASLEPDGLCVLRLDDFLRELSDSKWREAEVLANCSKDERGLSPERDFLKGALEAAGHSNVVERIRGILLTELSMDRLTLRGKGVKPAAKPLRKRSLKRGGGQ